jgi:hypothetical protein
LSDIFREVEEEVRRERFEKLWKQYGDYIIAGAFLVIIAIAAFELWQRYEENQRLKASETLIAAEQLADTGNFAQATPAFTIVAKSGPAGYAEMARLAQAAALLAAGQRVEAVQIYKSIAADDRGVIGAVALVRAGWALADSAPRSDLETLLATLTDPTSPWRYSAREILAYADFHAGQLKQAQNEFRSLADDVGAPVPMRRRTAAMAAFLKGGGMTNYGTVPPPAAPATPPTAPAPQ